MELIECTKKGAKGYKNGKSGTCHIGQEAKQRAIRDEKKKKAKAWKKSPRPLPEKPIKK